MDEGGSIIDFDATAVVCEVAQRFCAADATLALGAMNCVVALCRGGVDEERRSRCLPLVCGLMQTVRARVYTVPPPRVSHGPDSLARRP